MSPLLKTTRYGFLFLVCLFILSAGSPQRSVVAQIVTTPSPTPASASPWWMRGWEGETPLNFVPQSASHTKSTAADLFPAQTTETYPWVRAAFQSYRDGNWEIYAADDGGVNQRRLTYHEASDIRPAVRPGGEQILFASFRDGNWEIYRVNWDGSGLTRLTAHPALDTMPVWSPDGSQIAFVSDRDGNAEIYTMNADGSNVTRLTWRAEDDVMPSWSRDNQLAWIVASSQSAALWVMNGDGGNQHAIFQSYQGEYLEYPSWRRDSARIAVSRGPLSSIDGKIVWMDPDGSNVIWHNRPGLTGPTDFTMPQWGANTGKDGADGEAWLWYTKILYVSYNNQWYIDSSAVRRGKQDPYYWMGGDKIMDDVPVANSGYDMMPSVGVTDLTPPSSSVSPMPEYTFRYLPVGVTSSDSGGSGLMDLDRVVQFKIGENGSWINFAGDTAAAGDFYDWAWGVNPGDTVYFRSSAVDYALNVEPWPTDPGGDTHTTFFSSELRGRATDNRGVPFGATVLSFNPAAVRPMQTQSDGTFNAYLVGSHPTDVTIAAPGYTDNTMPGLTGKDSPNDVYLIPAPSLIRNGEFESGTLTPDWLTSSSWVTITASTYAGDQAVQMRSSFLGDVTLSQVITVPNSLNQPTLSFIHAVKAWPVSPPNPPIQLSVTADITTTTLYTATTPPIGNQLGWVDLTPWAGQTITVTFTLAQTDFDEETEILLDHITLAPWLTPLAETVTPAAFDPGVSTPITVTGQNFLDGVSVRLTRGDQIVSRVTLARLDAQTLTVDLPALGPGIYDLWVTNPGGQQSVRMGAIKVGKQSYLPQIAR